MNKTNINRFLEYESKKFDEKNVQIGSLLYGY